MSPHGLFELATSPNCLALNAAGTRLYSTDETDLRPENEAGSISSFAIDRSTGQLTLLNTVSSGGAGPAHLSIHPSGRFVLVANYFGGSVAVLPILPDGSLGAASDFQQDAARSARRRPPAHRRAASPSAATTRSTST
ncbi:MAG: beta-propeller fold lactonase family protein [Chthoniobacter sp.]